MRILWYSNAPWAPTGYGQQTALQVPKLQSLGHDVAVMTFHGLQGAPMTWNGTQVYPGSGEDPWAQDLMLGHYKHFQSDLLITLMDPWVLNAEHLNSGIQQGMRVAHWYPVDTEPLSLLDHRILTACGTRPIAMSRHGEKMLAEFGPLYVPHSIDTELFRPVSEEAKVDARQKGGFEGAFIIGVNAANQDPVRKGIAEQLLAFRLFADNHPDVRMLIHTRKQTRTGANLDRMVELLKLGNLVQFGEQYLTASGLTTSGEIARWYGICDIFSNCAYGEGFGLPIIEAQAAGTPVVVTDASAMTELCGSGWLVGGEYYWNGGHSSWWTKPSVQAILAAYEQAYEERGTPEADERRRKAREFALQYNVDLVLKKYWEPVLDELEGVAGTEKHAGLRWVPGTEHQDEVAEAVLKLVPEGGVLVDAVEDDGDVAIRAATKAGRVIATRLEPAKLRENTTINGMQRQVQILDKLDLTAEPFIDVLHLNAGALEFFTPVIRQHNPQLVLAAAKGKQHLRGDLEALGYKMTLIPGTSCAMAVHA